jgi:hypothetical protein
MKDGLATLEDVRRFKRDLAAGKKTRADWGLWCWLCDEPQYAAIGMSPLIECNACYEASYARAARLESLSSRKAFT